MQTTLIGLFCAVAVLSAQSQTKTAPPSSQPVPYYLQQRGITNVVGTCTGKLMGGTLIISNSVTVNVTVQTGGGLVKMRNGTLRNTRPNYGVVTRDVPVIVHLRGYPQADQVRPGDKVKTTGVIFSSGAGVCVVDYYKPRAVRTFQ
jgi:hypothetical protein